jgi:hypothetical protein
LGAAVGAFASMALNDSIPSYKIELGNTQYIDDFVRRKDIVTYHSHDNNTITTQQSECDIGVDVGSLMPNDPRRDDEKNQTAQMPALSNKQKLNHIFKNALGHREFSQELYDAMNQMVNDTSNHLGPDQYGVQWFAKMLENGEQMWARAQAGEVISAGINATPRIYCPVKGLVSAGI